MRIRTETSKLVFLQNQIDEDHSGALEICPTCGQQLTAPVNNAAELPPFCPDIHDESNKSEGVLEPKKLEE